MRLISAIAALSLLASPVLAGSAVGTATVQILKPVTVTQTQALQFGPVIPPPAGTATATLFPNGTTGGSATFGAGTHQQGIFNVNGTGSTAIVVSVDPTITASTPSSDTLTVSTITDLPPGGITALNGSGNATVQVGGSFTVGATTVPGAYTGSFTVTALYQ